MIISTGEQYRCRTGAVMTVVGEVADGCFPFVVSTADGYEYTVNRRGRVSGPTMDHKLDLIIPAYQG